MRPLPRRSGPRALAAFAICGVSMVACADDTVAPVDATRVAAGTWGGVNSGAIVTDSVMHVHIGCTFGDIPGIVTLGANGTFSRDGSYMVRAYPIAVGPSVPARFVGQVRGNQLTIGVTVNDTVEKVERVYGPVIVTYGTEPQLGPCPICSAPGMRAPAETGVLARLRRYIASSMSRIHGP
jgi:hypothetical protein